MVAVTIAPTTPDRVAAAAGLIPGSMATTGIVSVALSASADPAVPVLEPITMAFTPCPTRKPAISRPRLRMYSAGLSYEKSYKNGDPVQVCSPVSGSASLKCPSGSIGAPKDMFSKIVFTESRILLKVGAFAVAPRIEYDFAASKFAAKLPIYLAPNKDKVLTGGLDLKRREEVVADLREQLYPAFEEVQSAAGALADLDERYRAISDRASQAQETIETLGGVVATLRARVDRSVTSLSFLRDVAARLEGTDPTAAAEGAVDLALARTGASAAAVKVGLGGFQRLLAVRDARGPMALTPLALQSADLTVPIRKGKERIGVIALWGIPPSALDGAAAHDLEIIASWCVRALVVSARRPNEPAAPVRRAV